MHLFPFLCAQAVTSLSWQRSNPIAVRDSRSGESALLGNSNEESVIMPDPLPAGTRGRTSTGAASSKPSNRTNQDAAGGGGPPRPKSAGGDVTPLSSMRAWGNGPISRLQTPRTNSFNSGKDDMEVFSPLVDVQPITPSISGYWDGGGTGDEFNKDMAALGGDNRRTSTWGTPSVRQFPNIEEVKEDRRESRDSRDSSVSRRSSLGGRQVHLITTEFCLASLHRKYHLRTDTQVYLFKCLLLRCVNVFASLFWEQFPSFGDKFPGSM